MSRNLSHLIFSTRSATPRGGSDFVRQIVAESPGIDEAAKQAFALRADIAGSVLHHEREDPRSPLKVVFFDRLDDETWLFGRAISLGLYRKGSHQLLVHGVLLPLEVLEWLEGNPLVLDTPRARELGFELESQHPGASPEPLPRLVAKPELSDVAFAHNRSRLSDQAIPPASDRWLADAYDALRADRRVACLARDPRPETIESLLLHFHPDDRMALSFHSFYTHSRPIDYRLVGVLSADLGTARRHFPGVEVADTDARQDATGTMPGRSLGWRACQVRRHDPDGYLERVEEVRLTLWAHRRTAPLDADDAAFALATRPPDAMVLNEAGEDRLTALRHRAGGGLAVRVQELVGRWSKRPEHFDTELAGAARVGARVGLEELEHYRERFLPHGDQHRWALAALLTRKEVWRPGTATEAERLAIVHQLLPRERWHGFLTSLTELEAPAAEDVVRHWAVRDARHGTLDPGNRVARPYWYSYLDWMDRRGRALASAIHVIEDELARRDVNEGVRQAWGLLAALCEQLERDEDVLRIRFERELPALDTSDARALVRHELDRLSRTGRTDALDALAPHLDRPGVAEAAFLALARQPALAIAELPTLLERADSVVPEALEAGGALIGVLAWHRFAGLEALTDRLGELVELGGGDEVPACGVRVLAAAAATLRKPCRFASTSDARTRAVTAVAALVEARLRHGPVTPSDANLLALMVDARMLASTTEREPIRSGAAARLDRAWVGLLHLVRKGDLRSGVFGRDEALRWLNLLQDDFLDEAPEMDNEDDPRLAVFVAMAWSAWSRCAEGSVERATLSTKLRWVASLNRPKKEENRSFFALPERLKAKKTDHDAWHTARLKASVPESLQRAARAVLAPIALHAGGESMSPTGESR